ncbi:hypothetical protein [Aggregatilinea lenta]|uniref:hypothetical protein n=1 Tax=Aggregatilinea lenta TaxID=913108 RepID=UPI000E5B7940|nr:hypothetical protein [Aggregatilinea lenta]
MPLFEFVENLFAQNPGTAAAVVLAIVALMTLRLIPQAFALLSRSRTLSAQDAEHADQHVDKLIELVGTVVTPLATRLDDYLAQLTAASVAQTRQIDEVPNGVLRAVAPEFQRLHATIRETEAHIIAHIAEANLSAICPFKEDTSEEADCPALDPANSADGV